MIRYNPMMIFPFFVMFVLILGVLYAAMSKNQFADRSLAQTHIAADTIPTDMPITNDKKDGVKLEPPLNELKFPDTSIIMEATNSMRLESTAESTSITDWYKEKIRALGYSSKSFVTANTNGNIENRLLGTKDQEELFIEIKKPNGFIKTAINIELSKP